MNTKEIDLGYKIRHALNESIESLPTPTLERLASARKLALQNKKNAMPIKVLAQQTALAGGNLSSFFGQPFAWLMRLGVIAPLVAGALLFVAIYQHEQLKHINETADIDVAVLTDELPLSAYLDHGFDAFISKRGE